MRALFTAVFDSLCRGEAAVLCSLIRSDGSTPRGAGAGMAVFRGGSIVGTVGGGAVEYACIRHAESVFDQKTSLIETFTLTHNADRDIGMICGGSVTVFFSYLSPDDAALRTLLDEILSAYSERRAAWLVTRIIPHEPAQMGLFDKTRGLRFLPDADADAVSRLACAGAVLSGDESLYVEPLVSAVTAYVFGGGHVAAALVPVITKLGFPVVLVEDRAEFADAARFPDAIERIVTPFPDAFEKLAVTADDYVIIMSRGHQGDYELIRQALKTDAYYIGVIGSRKKIESTNNRLRAEGFGDSDLARLHTPIGLPILAETPEEIAVSIAAELILTRAGRYPKK